MPSAPSQDTQRNPPEARYTDSVLAPLHGPSVEHDYTGPAPGELRFPWIHGSLIAAHNRDTRLQVMRYNDDTVVMRQNICVDWRGPFTYLLFGNRGALLIDTGATADPRLYPLRRTVDALLTQHQQVRRQNALPLTVTFTSAECTAQNAGAAQFTGRPHTTTFARPSTQIDLGGRIVDVLPTPGTHRDGLSFYDRYTGLLFTGDLLFPGKILVANERDLRASLTTLAQWHQQHPVHAILGGHIDMQFMPGRAYDRFATFKPYERALPLPPETLATAAAAANEIAGKRIALARPDFWLLQGVGPDQEPDKLPELPVTHAPQPL